jgi:hypothetical protein
MSVAGLISCCLFIKCSLSDVKQLLVTDVSNLGNCVFSKQLEIFMTFTSDSTTQESVQQFRRFVALPKEQQLQAQRDIVAGADSEISHAYKAVSSSAKLDVWLRLARAMEDGTVTQVPSDYKLPDETNDFVNKIKGLDFEQRIDFTRSAVFEMGAK